MRDLAKQSFSSPRSSRNRNVNAGILRLVLVLAVIFAAGYFFKSKFLNSGGVSGSSDVILREAPRGLSPVKIDGGDIAQGKEIKSESATFKLVKEDFSGNVSASRNLDGGMYNIRVDATLEDPKQAYSYGVWLVDGEEEELVDYLGGAGTSWYLNASRGKELMNFDTIWITRENSRMDGSEVVLFEGSF